MPLQTRRSRLRALPPAALQCKPIDSSLKAATAAKRLQSVAFPTCTPAVRHEGISPGMLRKFEKDPATLCLGRTLWKLKDQAWGQRQAAQRTAAVSMSANPHPAPKRRIHAAADAAQQA